MTHYNGPPWPAGTDCVITFSNPGRTLKVGEIVTVTERIVRGHAGGISPYIAEGRPPMHLFQETNVKREDLPESISTPYPTIWHRADWMLPLDFGDDIEETTKRESPVEIEQ